MAYKAQEMNIRLYETEDTFKSRYHRITHSLQCKLFTMLDKL